MPIDPKIALEYVGIDPEQIEDEDALKEAFDSQYVRREQAHTDKAIADKVFGKINGTLRSKLTKWGKDLSVDFDFASADPIEGLEALSKAMKTEIDKARSDLAEAKKDGSSDADVEALKQKVTTLEGERDAFKTSAGDFEQKFNDLEKSTAEKAAQSKVNEAWSDAIKAVPFGEGVNSFAKKGFAAEAREKYRLEFGDDGAVKVIDVASGSIRMDKKSAQTFAKLSDILKAEAEEAKLLEAEGKPVRKVVSTTAGGLGSQQEEEKKHQAPPTGRRVMPRS